MIDFAHILSEAPDNFVIQDALARCVEVLSEHDKVLCAVSGGADSDVMLDMIIRCGGKEKTTFAFCDTGLEYDATKRHLTYLQDKYGIDIATLRPKKTIPASCREFGVPFWGKFASEMMYRLQFHGFQWEDEPFETLTVRYPGCKTALAWWCNVQKGNTTQFVIGRSPYLKEYIMSNPPQFRISNKCCEYAKKKAMHDFERAGNFDLVCTGVRKSEGGIRANAFKNCFTPQENGVDAFRPVFWLRDCDKECYCNHYGITHSRCYTEYGLCRTGCFGCPLGKRFEDELKSIEQFEPKLLKAANSIFADSYEYTRDYLRFREHMKTQNKSAKE